MHSSEDMDCTFFIGERFCNSILHTFSVSLFHLVPVTARPYLGEGGAGETGCVSTYNMHTFIIPVLTKI